MSINTSIRVKDVRSSIEWAPTPDMIEVSFSAEFIAKAEKCVAFMKETGVSYMVSWCAFGYELYDVLGSAHVEEGEPIFLDGLYYEPFDPEYGLEGCHAKIYSDGDIRAVIPLKHTNDEIWCSLGNVEQLKKLAGDVGGYKPPVLEQEGDYGCDFRLKEDFDSCWITVDSINIYVKRGDEGVIVDLFAKGTENESHGSTYAYFKDCEEEISSSLGIEIDAVAGWVGQHYKVNFEAESPAKRMVWIKRYQESHAEATAEVA